MRSSLRHLPAVHRLLSRPGLGDAARRWGRDAVAAACRTALDDLRARAVADDLSESAVVAACERLEADILHQLEAAGRDLYPTVVNATGVLLHTNLGRAPLGELPGRLGCYLALEYDLATGSRGQRLAPLAARAATALGSEAAAVVNNNAAALYLMLLGVAADREVVVSRGQLIEIGGSFRLPDVMAAAGAHLAEVGCTNRTRPEDYTRAINDRTAAILVAHPSNYRMIGYTQAPTTRELAALAHRHGLPLLVDQGSGCLHDLRRWGLPPEETVGELLTAGADAVCFSGDKLLGGPQAGIIVGSDRVVTPLGRHPVYRALRPDKTTLVMVDAVLGLHARGDLERIPLYAMLETPVERLRRRAATLGRRLRASGVPVRGRATRATLGGGTTPGETLASYGLELDGGHRVVDALRDHSPPVIARIEDERVVLDLRTVLPEQDRTLAEALAAAVAEG